MRSLRGAVGASAERVAAALLERDGFTILERNWRCRAGEIDLVAVKDDTTVFVEVRARRTASMGSAAESITPAKRAHLLAAVAEYEAAHPDLPPGRRIDVVTVDGGGRGVVVRRIENAIEA